MYTIKQIFASRRNFYILLFAGMVLRTFPFGFTYFPILDDPNAYGIFSIHPLPELWRHVVLHYYLYAFRPLAGLVDAYIYSRFWGNMQWVLLFIMTLQFSTIFLLDEIARISKIGWGRAAAVFFVFFPASTESAYWINASSRIVMSVFLAALAGYALLRYLNRQRWQSGRGWLGLMLGAGLAAQGFYEQGIIFTFVFLMGLLFLHREQVRKFWLWLWPMANVGIIGIHYLIFRNHGHLAERTGLAGGISHFPETAARIGRTFIREQFPTITNGLDWGFAELGAGRLIIIAIFAILLTLFVIYDKPPDFDIGRTIAAGVILIAAPLSIFFILADGWIWVRNFYFSLIGLGILVNIIYGFLIQQNSITKVAGGLICGIMVFLFAGGFVLEVQSYGRVAEKDGIIIHKLAQELARQDTDDREVWFFGLRWTYAPTINDRITSPLRLDWALNGHLGAYTRQRERPWIIPVMNGQPAPINPGDLLFGLSQDPETGELFVKNLIYYNGILVIYDNALNFGRITDGNFWQD